MSKLHRLKHSIKVALKSWLLEKPGGKAILQGLKIPLRIYRFVKFCLFTTPTGRLILGGERLLSLGQRDAGMELLEKALRRQPNNIRVLVKRAEIWYFEGRADEAFESLSRALELVRQGAKARWFSNALMAEVLVARGDIDRAVEHWIENLRRSWEEAPDRPKGNVPNPWARCSADLRFDAMNNLAEYIMNERAGIERAVSIYTQRRRLRNEYCGQVGLDRLRTVVLPDDWVRNIGHMGYLEYWVKLRQLGWIDCEHIILLAPADRTANAAFLEPWRRHMTVITDPVLARSLAPLAEILGDRVAGDVALPDGRSFYFFEALGLIQSEWERRGGGAVLSLTDEENERGRACLRKFGVPDDAWFATIHTREAGFHREGKNLHQAHRNSRIGDYELAIRAILKRGGWIVRLGDRSMERLPAMERVIDYAHRPEKSPWMDIFLCASSRFFLGSASGLCQVPFSFGVPCVLTNWISNALPQRSSKVLFIPKLLRSIRENRVLTFAEALASETRRRCYNGVALKQAGLDWLDNSQQEIASLVVEMMDTLDGKWACTDRDRALQARFQSIAEANGVFGCARIGRDFLRQHSELCEEEKPCGYSEPTRKFSSPPTPWSGSIEKAWSA